MQKRHRQHKGNPHRPKRCRSRSCAAQQPSPASISKPVRLSLHESDPITGNEDSLYTLFYECYRGYTIYSTAQGWCCLHGPGKQGCLRLEGQYVSFPDVEDAKNLIKYFRTQGMISWQSMERSVPQEIYVCLNRRKRQHTPMVAQPLQRVS